MKYFLLILSSLNLLLINDVAADKNVKYGEQVTFIKNRKRLINTPLQHQLKNTKNWKFFTEKYGNCYVEFDEYSKIPRKLFGTPIGNYSYARDADIQFIQDFVALYSIPEEGIKQSSVSKSDQYISSRFMQYYKGLEILNARADVKMNYNNEIVMFGCSFVPDIDIPVNPGLKESDITNFLLLGLADTAYTLLSDSMKLKILPIPEDTNYLYKLVYEVEFTTHAGNEYYSLLDAHTGQILYRTKLNKNLNNTSDLQVSGDILTQSLLSSPKKVDIPFLQIVIDNTLHETDKTGYYQHEDTSATSVTYLLQGKWARVYDAANNSKISSYTDTLLPGLNQVHLNDSLDIHHLSAYYHVNTIHDHMNNWLPNFTRLDNSFNVVVNRDDGECNAFYSPNQNSINFYENTSNCRTWASVADVVYHEYGHAINTQFYRTKGKGGMSNGALNEAYADIWALTLTKNPVLGVGIYNNPSLFVRRYDIDPKVYPIDIVGVVHDDGEIIAGAWWDLGQELDSIDLMMELFVKTYDAVLDNWNGNEGELYRDVLLEVLLIDDDDADLTNGTPHSKEILTAFANHGIALVMGELAHTEIENVAEQKPTSLSINTSNLFFSQNPILYYKEINDQTWQSKEVSITTGQNEVQETIEGYPKGAIIEYYFSVPNIMGASNYTLPNKKDDEKDLHFYYLVGHNLEIEETFESESSDWVIGDFFDNATSGLWEIGEPIPSEIGNEIVQTGIDKTIKKASLNRCAYTENPVSSSSTPYRHDVDNGQTTLYSPVYDISTYPNTVITYHRWYTNNLGSNPDEEYWQVYISNDQGEWKEVERTSISDNAWRKNIIPVNNYFESTNNIQLKFVAADENGRESLVEAAIDDIFIYKADNPIDTIPSDTFANLSIYPSPSVDGYFNLGLPSNKIDRLEVVNTNGKVILSVENPSSNLLDMRAQASGVYIITVKYANGEIDRAKVVIQ